MDNEYDVHGNLFTLHSVPDIELDSDDSSDGSARSDVAPGNAREAGLHVQSRSKDAIRKGNRLSSGARRDVETERRSCQVAETPSPEMYSPEPSLTLADISNILTPEEVQEIIEAQDFESTHEHGLFEDMEDSCLADHQQVLIDP
jgi:hypothetical protein